MKQGLWISPKIYVAYNLKRWNLANAYIYEGESPLAYCILLHFDMFNKNNNLCGSSFYIKKKNMQLLACTDTLDSFWQQRPMDVLVLLMIKCANQASTWKMWVFWFYMSRLSCFLARFQYTFWGLCSNFCVLRTVPCILRTVLQKPK